MTTCLPFENSLSGCFVTLKRFEPSHLPDLKAAGSHEGIWEVNRPVDQSVEDFLNGYMQSLTQTVASQEHVAYTVCLNRTGEVVGSTRFYDIFPFDKRLAIGFTWYHPSVWGAGVNLETKLLLMTYVFEELQFNRVEFHIDSRNARSIKAVLKLGATREGVLRQHKIVQGDYVRDTVLCSIVKSDWPCAQEKIKNLLDDISG